MKMNEVKKSVSSAFEDVVTKTYCFMLNHPVISTCIGTLTGAAVATGISVIANARNTHQADEDAPEIEFINEWSEMNND